MLALKYRFKPGAGDDGVTLIVPVSLLNRVNATRCEWLVPGMLHEKVVAMIKSLPKQLRRNFVPAPDFAERCGPLMLRDPNRSLTEALASALQQLTGTTVNQDDWQTELWPDHLLMRAELLDEHGKTIDEGSCLLYTSPSPRDRG